jgi:hypothetical protein
MGFGLLRIGTSDLSVVDLRLAGGQLHVIAHGPGPVELAVEEVTWIAPDGTTLCVIRPFLVDERDIQEARTATSVTVEQPIRITEITVVRRPAPVAP